MAHVILQFFYDPPQKYEVCHFGMVEAMGLKIMALGSSSMA
jgi:hypothetical protein